MLLLFLVNIAVTVGDPKRPYAISNTNPSVTAVEAIPACDSGIYIRPPCYDFFYTPDNDPNINVRRQEAGPRWRQLSKCSCVATTAGAWQGLAA